MIFQGRVILRVSGGARGNLQSLFEREGLADCFGMPRICSTVARFADAGDRVNGQSAIGDFCRDLGIFFFCFFFLLKYDTAYFFGTLNESRIIASIAILEKRFLGRISRILSTSRRPKGRIARQIARDNRLR